MGKWDDAERGLRSTFYRVGKLRRHAQAALETELRKGPECFDAREVARLRAEVLAHDLNLLAIEKKRLVAKGYSFPQV